MAQHRSILTNPIALGLGFEYAQVYQIDIDDRNAN